MEFSYFQYLANAPSATSSCWAVDSLALSLASSLPHQVDSSKLVVSMGRIDSISGDAAQALLSAIAELPVCTKIINCNSMVLGEMAMAAWSLSRSVWLQEEEVSVPMIYGDLPSDGKEILDCLGQHVSLRPRRIAAYCDIPLEVVVEALEKFHKDRAIDFSMSDDEGEVFHVLPFGGRLAVYDHE